MNNPLKYTDPTGYQTAPAPGAVSWLGGDGGWGESGRGFGGNVNWDYFANMNLYTNWQGKQVGFMDTPINLDPGQDAGITYTGEEAKNMFIRMFSPGIQTHIYVFFGKIYVVISDGPPGDIYGSEEKGFYASDPSKTAVSTGEASVTGKPGKRRVSTVGGGKIDWGGVANATISMAGGAAEIAVAGGIEYFSIGLATPASGALMLDGSARVFANMQRLYFYLNGNPALGNAYPTSLGGIVGKGVDMAFGVPADKIGFGQAIGSWGNDLSSFIVMGGTGNALYDLIISPSPQSMSNYLFTVGVYPYSMYYDKPNK